MEKTWALNTKRHVEIRRPNRKKTSQLSKDDLYDIPTTRMDRLGGFRSIALELCTFINP